MLSNSQMAKESNKKKKDVLNMEGQIFENEGILMSTLDPLETEVLQKTKEIIKTLDLGEGNRGFNSWPIDRLISAREKLARYSEPLGEFISIHETQSDFAYIWRKGAYASDWTPLKDKFPKSTIADLEKKLDEKYIQEQYFSSFHRHRADLLIRELEAVDRVIRSIDHRIRELERQFRLEHNPDQIIT